MITFPPIKICLHSLEKRLSHIYNYLLSYYEAFKDIYLKNISLWRDERNVNRIQCKFKNVLL